MKSVPLNAFPRTLARGRKVKQLRSSGRVPAVISCGAAAARLYGEVGLRRIYLGDEAVLELESFDIETAERKSAREGWHRGVREGWTAALAAPAELISRRNP